MPDLAHQIRDRLDGWAPAPFEFSFPPDWAEEQRDKFNAEIEDLRVNGVPEGPRRPPRSWDYPVGGDAPFSGLTATEPATPEEIERWQQAWDKLLSEGATFRPIKLLPPGPLAYPGFEQMRDAILAVLDFSEPGEPFPGEGDSRDHSEKAIDAEVEATLAHVCALIADKLGIEAAGDE